MISEIVLFEIEIVCVLFCFLWGWILFRRVVVDWRFVLVNWIVVSIVILFIVICLFGMFNVYEMGLFKIFVLMIVFFGVEWSFINWDWVDGLELNV